MHDDRWPFGGEMARRVRERDWAGTPLGPIALWPAALRIALDLVLAHPLPMALAWGPDLISFHNDAYLPLLGDKPGALGRPFLEVWAEIRDAIAPQIGRALAGEAIRLQNAHFSLRRYGGPEDAYFNYTLSPVRDEAGRVAGVLNTAFETTAEVTAERRRRGVQDRLRESEARNRLLVDSWAQAVWETDGAGLVTADSPSWRAYTGQTREAWLGYGWLDAIHPQDRAYAERQWREAVAAGRLVNAEFRLRALDGGWRWTNVRAAPVRDGLGRLEKWVGMNIDIDSRKRIEAALRETEERNAVLIAFSDEVRGHGDPARIAEAACRILSQRLGTDRTLWAVLDEETRDYVADWAFLADGTRLSPSRWPFDPREPFAAEHLAGRTVAYRDSRADPRIPGPVAAAMAERGLGAGIAAPVLVAGALRAVLSTSQPAAPRSWQPGEVALVEALAGLAWAEIERARAKTALRDSEARLALALRTLPVGIAILGIDGDIAVSNDAMRRFLPTGIIPSRDPGRSDRWSGWDGDGRRVPPSDFPSARALRGETVAPGMQMLYRDDDGTETWTEVLSAPLRDGEGRVAGAISVVVDVDRVKRSEERAQASEELLRHFGEASRDMLWIRDADTLQWTYLTAAFEPIYGLGVEEALTGDNYRNWQDLIVPEDRALAEASIGRVREGEHATFEYRIRRPLDGGLRWLRNTDFPMRDASGRVRWIGGISRDVTAAREAEERLRTSEERLRSAAEVARFALWDWNLRTGEVVWSDEHFRMEGYAVGEPVPSYAAWIARIHPEDRAGTEAALRAAQDERRDYVHEFRALHPDGALRWLSARGRFFYDGNEAVRMIGAMVDTTARREWEEAQKVMVAELQHRTRNLIAVVRGIADDTMEETGPTEAFRQGLAHRLAALARVQGLLSRAEVEPITLAAVVRLELDALGAGMADPRVTVAGPDVWLRNATVQTLALALHELATNARKYGALSHEGGRLAVTWSERAEGGERRLLLDWTETGLDRAPVRMQPSSEGGGYGRELIERALPHALGARTSYVLAATGVHCTIDLPARPDPRDRGMS